MILMFALRKWEKIMQKSLAVPIIVLFMFTGVFGLLKSGGAWATIQSCNDLSDLSLSDLNDAPSKITGARFVQAEGALPAFCDVIGYTAPQVSWRVRLPEDWNGRFHMEGCGTLCGVRIIENADDPLSRGTAVATTDMGRSAPLAPAEWTGTGRPDYNTIMRSGEWAYNNLEQELDYAYRGTHKAVLASKAIVRSYYKNEITHAYWRGCSTGGRQGLMLAQRYPWHFDGIIVGAPAGIEPAYINIFWRTLTNLTEDGRAIIGQSQVPALHREVMNQCDGADGLEDGVIDDPWACEPDLSTLRCASENPSDTCFTDEQILSVERLYEGAFLSDGTRVSWGVPKGGELGVMRYILNEAGEAGTFEPMAQDRLRYTWFDYDPGPKYDAGTFDLDDDYHRLFTKGFLQAPSNPDLTTFKERGGKLIAYQGLNDMLNAEPLIDYFKKVERITGGEAVTDEFMRLYLIPGMNHCRGGSGVDTVDWITEIQGWVEESKAPGIVTGHRRDGDISLPGAGAWPLDPDTVIKTRPLYDYPNSARYSGSGDRNDAANFVPRPLSH